MSSRKRKHSRRDSPDYSAGGEGTSSQASPLNTLFVQAHEATIIRDRADVARLLTSHNHDGKGGLIQWQADVGDSGRELWVDRYDARLLLTSLPGSNTQIDAPSRSSPTGWSDLPSDTEDTFFFSTEEIEDLRRKKQVETMDASRVKRLRSLRESDRDPVHDLEDERMSWGGHDEEPDEGQRVLMERTAKHLLSSPNPAQLEMRILANHGSDPRFTFLRGRWRNAWRVIRQVVREEQGDLARQAQANPVGGLVAYGDSDDENEDIQDDENRKGKITNKKVVDETEARAREWLQKQK